jgi:hypothetical protein
MLGFPGNRKKPQLTKDDLLASRVVLNQAVTWSMTDEHVIKIDIPRREDWWVKLLSKLFYTPENRTIALDEVGTFVWQSIEEGRTVESMIGHLAKQYKLNRREAEASLIAYLQTLGKKNLIGFEVPRSRAGKRQ